MKVSNTVFYAMSEKLKENNTKIKTLESENEKLLVLVKKLESENEKLVLNNKFEFKIGDILYGFSAFKTVVIEWEIINIIITKNGHHYRLKSKFGEISKNDHDISNNVFKTREEAEIKLKNIKENRMMSN